MTLGNLIKNYRVLKNLTMQEFADKADLSKGYISMLEKGKHPQNNRHIIPSIETVKKLADAMNMSVDEVLAVIDGNQLIDISHRKPDPDLSGITNIMPLQKARRIPILGIIACGKPIWAEQNYEGYFIADAAIKADFCLYAKGDSMIDAEIYDGDIVFLKRTPDVENGQIGVVLIDNEATLKRVYKTTDALVLQPCNAGYSPIIVDSSQDVMILGECVGVYHATK